MDYPWISMDNPEGRGGGGQKNWEGGRKNGRGVNKFRFVSDRGEFSGQLGGAPGSTKDHFKLDIGRYFEVFLICVRSIRDRSGTTLGPSRASFGVILLYFALFCAFLSYFVLFGAIWCYLVVQWVQRRVPVEDM